MPTGEQQRQQAILTRRRQRKGARDQERAAEIGDASAIADAGRSGLVDSFAAIQ